MAYEDKWVVLIHQVVAYAFERRDCPATSDETVNAQESTGDVYPYQAIDIADGGFAVLTH